MIAAPAPPIRSPVVLALYATASRTDHWEERDRLPPTGPSARHPCLFGVGGNGFRANMKRLVLSTTGLPAVDGLDGPPVFPRVTT